MIILLFNLYNWLLLNSLKLILVFWNLIVYRDNNLSDSEMFQVSTVNILWIIIKYKKLFEDKLYAKISCNLFKILNSTTIIDVRGFKLILIVLIPVKQFYNESCLQFSCHRC